MSNITYCGIHFNVEWVQEQTEEEFVENPDNANHWKQPGFTISTKARKERLKELYQLVQKDSHANIKQPYTSGRQPEPEQPDPGEHGSGLADVPGAAEGAD